MADKFKLHRCSWTFLHTDADACWKVQRALDEQGVEYEVVKHGYGKGKKMRDGVRAVGGDGKLPVLELPAARPTAPSRTRWPRGSARARCAAPESRAPRPSGINPGRWRHRRPERGERRRPGEGETS
jgi:hypothetical protein